MVTRVLRRPLTSTRRSSGRKVRETADVGALVVDLTSDVAAQLRAERILGVEVAGDNALTVRQSTHRTGEFRRGWRFELQGRRVLAGGNHESDDYGQSCIVSTRRRLRIAHFSGSRSFASNFFHVSRVNLSSLTRFIVSTMRHQHSTTTGGAGLLLVTTSGPG